MERSMLNSNKDIWTNIWIKEREDKVFLDIISNVRKMKCPGQLCTSTASKTMDTARMSTLGDHTTRKDYKGDQPSGGEKTWTNIGGQDMI